ncbi:hypothetical protein FBEOM_9443 [Fusarium beomiforme]|uniref:Uncharacterized protein n=1 Tax=Fusarium beomiforme TaxID=44412 RepID=A0A9P5AEW5_9HYPO|nr:hypothetical protein FBEOM_9443 [Fusarium beomiforme]
MAPKVGLADRYHVSMQHHPYGYALFEPAPFSRLQPGSLGYLDEFHLWHPILNLLDSEELKKSGYPPLGELRPSEPDIRRFGPLLSNKTAETSLDLEAGVGAAAMGLPVDVSGAVKYSTSNEFGAVLVCEKDVVSEGFDLRQPFSAWLEKNAKSLFKEYPDGKKHGFYAVTWTYSSTDIHISAWDGSSINATVGFKVGMAGAGNVGPQMSWVRGRSSSGWTEWTDQKRVLFFRAVYLGKNIFGNPKIKKSGNLPKGIKKLDVEGDEGEMNLKAFLSPVGDTYNADVHSIDESAGIKA